jgi:hypothetical protein
VTLACREGRIEGNATPDERRTTRTGVHLTHED